MKNTIKKELCTGCRACELICPLDCISMVADEEGFLYPEIDTERCIQCGKCQEVCAADKPLAGSFGFEKRAFAVWNRDLEIRRNSSSGGVFYALAEQVLSVGGIVYGAAFDDDFEVRHRRIETIEELPALMGSKYVQSDTGRTYRLVLEDLKSGFFVLYSGTPCQISALLRFVGEYSKQLITASVICHGVPSPDVWRKYLSLKKGQYGENVIKKISFRDKSSGWKNFCVYMEFERYRYLRSHREDLYMQGFLQNLFLRSSCYQCRAKGFSTGADIVMGDFWGIHEEIPGIDTDIGVSSVIVCTSKGLELWNKVKQSMCFWETSCDAICRHNNAFGHSVPRNNNRDSFFKDLADIGLVEEAMEEYLKPGGISDTERHLYQYDIVNKYLEKKIQGCSIEKKLHQYGADRIVLYAVTDLLDMVLTDILSGTGEFSVFISDRQYRQLNGWYKGMQVVAPHELKHLIENKMIDGIVVCNPMRENEIIDGFLADGIGLEKIFSLVSLIFD